MSDQRWDRIRDLLDRALRLEPGERAEFLDSECSGEPELREELDSLLRAHERSGPLDALMDEIVGPMTRRLRQRPEPETRIGPYRLVRLLGSGGMGAVYLARREDPDFDQSVALKLMRLGFGSEELYRRFVHERQILARLTHPNIARLLDGGVTETGQPYFAMEYVEGSPIDVYCDDRQLSVEDRLRLFGDVCDAVQYAHQSLIVHRDLKPSNVLVTRDGTVKLLDFGIAKLLATDADIASPTTRTGRRWLTPEYASPEQVRGEPVTTASDTYSLGVLLYELLAGCSPYRVSRATPGGIERVVCEEMPDRPSTVVTQRAESGPDENRRSTPEQLAEARSTQPGRLKRRLAGDLDTIVLKALRKEPARRYAAAGQLAEDIRRHLAGLPVQARPDTLAYRASKFVRRHRWGVTAGALVLLSLIAGIAGTAWQASRAGEQARLAAIERDRARGEAAKAEQVSAFLIDLFRAPDPGRALGEEPSVDELLERGVERLDAEGELAEQPALRASMLQVLGEVYQAMGRYDEARPLFEKALALREEQPGPDSLDLAESLAGLGLLALYDGRLEDAAPLIRESLAIRRRSSSVDRGGMASALNNLAAIHLQRSQLDSAEALLMEAAAIRRELDPEGSPELATNLTGLAIIARRKGDLERADSLNREALRIRQARLDPEHPDVARSMQNLATTLNAKGEYEEAESWLRRAIPIWRKVLGDEHPDVARAVNNLAAVLEAKGDLAGAESLYREALALKRKVYGTTHPSLAISLNNLGLLLKAAGQYGEAERLLRESLEMRRSIYGQEHPSVARAMDNLGSLYLATGDLYAADSLIREALEMRLEIFGDDHPQVAVSLVSLGQLLRRRGRSADAVSHLERALEIRRRSFETGHPSIIEAENELTEARSAASSN